MNIEKAIQIFISHNGILKTSQALESGISPRTLYAMRDAGIIQKISRGIYQLAEKEPLENPDLVSVTLRIPKAVICLISALNFYELTTQIPHRVYIALPQSAEKPRLDFPPLDIIWLSERIYQTGITTPIIDGFKIKIYSKEKTITDCFKFRNKIGLDSALEALKNYLKTPDPQIDKLINYARINRVEKLITRYLEALL